MTDNPVPASPPLRKLVESLQERIEKLERHAPRVCFYCGAAGADTKGFFDVPEKPTCAECYPKHVGVKPAPEPSREQEKPGLSDLLKAAEVGALTVEALDQARADRDWLRAELAHEKKLGNELRAERDRLAAELAEKEAEMRRRLEGWQREFNELNSIYVAARDELATARQDVSLAAGELLVEYPPPGSDMARVMLANAAMRRECSTARGELDKATKNAFEAWAHAGQVQKERDAVVAELAKAHARDRLVTELVAAVHKHLLHPIFEAAPAAMYALHAALTAYEQQQKDLTKKVK